MRTDRDLLSAWQGGEHEAGAALIDRYSAKVYRFFSTRIEGSVDDLCQRTFTACVEARLELEHDGATRSFRSFLFGVARRQLLDAYRTHRREAELLDPLSQSVAEVCPGASAIHAANEEGALVAAAMKHLPIDYQIALELHYWEDMTTAEIAAALEIPRATAKTRLLRARERLKGAMSELTQSSDLVERTEGLARLLGRR